MDHAGGKQGRHGLACWRWGQTCKETQVLNEQGLGQKYFLDKVGILRQQLFLGKTA